MNKPTVTAVLLAGLLGGGASVAHADSFWDWFSFARLKGVEAVSDESWLNECGSCHFAYQPGLLPRRSWQQLLSATALEDHFGENAELDEALRQRLENYALAHAADDSIHKRSRQIMSSMRDDETPLRITATRYIKRKHGEIPPRLVTGNPQVKSASNCNNCHTKADEGMFDDDSVYIKGHGRYDD